MSSAGFRALRSQLDHLGYYQALVPESVPLVEALLHDLLATTHNLKLCQEKVQGSKSSDFSGPPAGGPATSTPILITSRFPHENVSKVAALESKVADLELLNRECMGVIKNLQRDVEERSKKILKLELAGNRAKIVTHHEKPVVIETSGPKIEMSTLITSKRSSTSSSSTYSGSSTRSQDLDIIAMYEKRNHELDADLQRLQEELFRAKEILSHVDKHWNKSTHQEKMVPEQHDHKQSAYLMKLVKDNAMLKEQLAAIDEHTKACFHGKRVLEPATVCCCGQKICCYQGSGRCPDNIREAVRQSHIELHNQCLKNQLKNKVSNNPGLAEAMKTHDHLDLQHKQLHQMEEEIRKMNIENRDLGRRIVQVTKINENLKDKVQQMSEQQKILLSSCNGGKVGQLIKFMEQQRDIYRTNVEELLDKLDPDRRKLGGASEVEAENKENKGFTGFTQKPKVVLKSNLPPGSVRVMRNVDENIEKKIEQKHYSPSAYRQSSSFGESTTSSDDESLRDRCNMLERELEDLSQKVRELNNEKGQLDSKLTVDNGRLRDEISRLRHEIEKLERENLENQRKIREQVSGMRDENDSAWSQFQNDLREYQREIESLRTELQLKESHVIQLSRERDVLHKQLDDREIEVDQLKKDLQEATARAEKNESGKSSQDRRLNQCLLEIEHLKSAKSDIDRQNEKLRERVENEKSFNRDILTENTKLKSDLQKAAEEAESNKKQTEDLRGHIQRYVNEVKRIEELLALRERERSELLDQYKHLAGEVRVNESYGRNLESQVSSLKLELSTRSAELQASELRLANMEKDLVEISLSNENYRTQVANLSSKIDLAETELRSIRAHTSWLAPDFTDVQQISDQLNAHKLELQRQLNEQAQEIEAQNDEIRQLREEINQLSKMIESERMKSAELQRQMSERDSGQRRSEGEGRER